MYLERLLSSKLAIFSAPLCFFKRIIHPQLVSFGLMSNISVLARQGLFRNIDVIIDVGANVGQYAYMVHSILPDIPIYSFEPDPECFSKLEQTFKQFNIPGKCFQIALSDHVGKSTFNIYENSANNSVLTRKDFQNAGGRTVEVSCSTLDHLIQEFAFFKNPMLKLDVQGFELTVLKGSKSILKRCKYVQLEASFCHAYQENAHIADLFNAMRDNGFRCLDIVDTLRLPNADNCGLSEADLLFINESA